MEAAGAAAYVANQAIVAPAAQALCIAIEPGPAYAVYAGQGSPVNRAVGLGMAGPVPGEALDLVEAFYRRRGEKARVDCCPLADSSLAKLLARRGYVLDGFKQVMAQTLPRTSVDQAEPNSPVTVSVAAPTQCDLWVDIISHGFSSAVGKASESDRAIARPSFGQADAVCLLAWADGQPVGGGVVAMRDGVALLRSESTLPEYRGRGVQSAVVRFSLQLAVEAGCELALVQAAPGSPSQRNLERAGFAVLYTKPTLIGPAS